MGVCDFIQVSSLANDVDSVPPAAVAALDLHDTPLADYIAVNPVLLVNLDVDKELAFIDAVSCKERLVATEASKFLLLGWHQFRIPETAAFAPALKVFMKWSA